jgi:hypothetical protein
MFDGPYRAGLQKNAPFGKKGRFAVLRSAQLIFKRWVPYRLDFFDFLAFFFGIIFFTTLLAFLATDFAAETTRLVTDFFFDFLAMLPPFGFLGGFLGALLCSFLAGFLRLLRGGFLGSFFRFLRRSFFCFLDGLGDRLNRRRFGSRFLHLANHSLSGCMGENSSGAYHQVSNRVSHAARLLFRFKLLFRIHKVLQKEKLADSHAAKPRL